MNGKGDSPRSCFSEQYRDNYDRIFRTITSADWRRSIKRARAQRNKLSEKIREAVARNDLPKP